MSGRINYNTLLNQYNIAVAKAQDLQEQLSTKMRQWEKRDEDFKTVEKLARELCSEILVKDNKEMVLGREYTWGSVPIMELIIKTRRVYQEDIAKKTDFIRKILDQSEERRQQAESLQEQIAVMKTQPGAMQISQEELIAQLEKEKKEQEALSNMPMKAREAVESGKATIVMDDKDKLNDLEEDLYADAAEINAKVQITPKSIPVTPNRKQFERKKERKKQKMMAHTINLKEYEAKLDDASWELIRIIGKEGISIYTEIETAFLQANPTISTSKCRSCIGNLTAIQITNKEPIINPLKGKLYAYHLTDMGQRLYKERFGEMPVISEIEKIIAEHDNLIHGYGIKFIADLLREKGEFSEVNDMNRKRPIEIGSGKSYIPDLVCIDENGHTDYIEYECVNHTQTAFNAKCNKMSKITNVLNFVVPNADSIAKIRNEISKWIENRGARSLSHITVRVTGACQFKDAEFNDNRTWKLVFKPGKRIEPFEN